MNRRQRMEEAANRLRPIIEAARERAREDGTEGYDAHAIGSDFALLYNAAYLWARGQDEEETRTAPRGRSLGSSEGTYAQV